MTIEKYILTFNQYYKEIQNYFNLTDSHEFEFERKVNSSKRSRSKLPTLNETQFFELCNDVHDELQRRLNSDKGNVESCLKPIDTFHKKRNLAREKLSLLSQHKFNNLLSDIVQEIERRGYHINNVSNANENHEGEISDNVNQATKKTSKSLKTIPPTDIGVNDNNINKEDSVQQTVIVPVKASINWSSDEEEEEQENEKQKEEVKQVSILPQINIETHALDEENIKKNNNFTENHSSERLSNNNVKLQINGKHTEPTNNNIPEVKISSTQPISQSKGIELKEPNSKQFGEPASSAKNNEIDINKKLTTMSMNKEITTKPPIIDKSDSKNTDSLKEIESLKNENLKLRKELEYLRSEKNNSHHKKISYIHNLNFDQHIDSSGHIPLNLVENFHNLTAHLYCIINESDPKKNKEKFGRVLFTKIFQISKNIQEIVLLSAVPEVETEIILLRTSLSHLITSIRYYCSFSDLLPKIVVNTTISDLCFSFCNLVSVVKIKSMDPANTKLDGNDFILNSNEATLVNDIDTTEIVSPNLSSKVKPLRLAEKFKICESPTSPIDNNKNRNSKLPPTPESNTSIIGTSTPNKGLLYEKIDIKSFTSSS